jgi:hypothetical protein
MFAKGKSGNPGGRPKGAKDKKTRQWEELGDFLVTEGAERYMTILSEMDDEKFFKHYTVVLEYFKPKQIRQDSNISFDGQLPTVIIKPVK